MNPVAQGGHGLFLESSDGKHPAPEGNFARHGNIAPHRRPGKSGNHRCGDGDARGGTVLGNRAFWEVDVKVAVFVKFSVDAQLSGAAADIRDGRVGGLLHHIAQVSGELHLAGAGDHIGLNFQQFAARTGPGKAVYHAHLLQRGAFFRVIPPDTQVSF
ncbi:hypothetical protein SDC9_129080 [bioreactor metagenome]|uniref:Uncharacterized protein n=1 Tax=bioreactor metagenome TaxID=1076179 RepID=A0A645CZM9_9ZZZZ